MDVFMWMVFGALVAGVGAVLVLVHFMLDGWEERQLRKRRELRRIQRQRAADEAAVELWHDLRDWGIPENLLINHRKVESSYDGVNHVAYDLPRDEFVRQVQRTTRVHQRMVAASGGHRPASS